MNGNVIEKCVAIIVLGIIAVSGVMLAKSDTMATMAIGAIAGLTGSGLGGDIKGAAVGLLGRHQTDGGK